MNLTEAKAEVDHIIGPYEKNVSLCICTDEGEININDNQRMAAASLIKLLILLEGFRQSNVNQLNLETKIEVTDQDRVGGSGVLKSFRGVEQLSVRNLMALMITVSDNTASNLLIDLIGMKNIQSFVNSVGCSNSFLRRHFMDTQAMKAGIENETTARDMVRCLKLIAEKNSIFMELNREEMLNMLSSQQFHKLINQPESPNIELYNKTGELPGIDHDVAILKHKERLVYIAMLTKGWKERETGLKIIKRIGQLMMRYIKEAAADENTC
ncbi:serine hydrolase [Bacillus gobiensis]|uniref:serine hydrolase n=1 Tax=Bacillus gobiensis TaxID=1441095 RepID=UPI003D19CAE1